MASPGHQSDKCRLCLSHNGRHIGFVLPRIWDQEFWRGWTPGLVQNHEGTTTNTHTHTHKHAHRLRFIYTTFKWRIRVAYGRLTSLWLQFEHEPSRGRERTYVDLVWKPLAACHWQLLKMWIQPWSPRWLRTVEVSLKQSFYAPFPNQPWSLGWAVTASRCLFPAVSSPFATCWSHQLDLLSYS